MKTTEISIEYGKGYAELSTRQNVQLHFITLPKLPDGDRPLYDNGRLPVLGLSRKR